MAERLVGFKRHLRTEVSLDQGAFLFSERGVTALRGAQIGALVALLDGTRDLATVLGARPGGMGADQVRHVLTRLARAGLLAFRPPNAQGSAEPALAYWDACGIDPDVRDTTKRVNLVTAGAPGDTAAVSAALEAAGLQLSAGDSDVSLVLCDDYLHPDLAEIDAAHRATGRPWLLAKPIGAQVWIGPIFQPGESACWHCLAHRLWRHRHAEACVQSMLGRRGPAPRAAVSVPPLAAAAANLVALELVKWLGGHRHPGQRSVWTFDSLDLGGRFHELRARPQCSECGDVSLMARQARRPVRVPPTPKVTGAGGGHRSLRPEQVLERYRHLMSPVTGVIKEITRDPRGPASFHSFRSGPNLGARVGDLDSVYRGLRDESGGKGVTALDAEVGALCEAVERHSGRFHGDEERVRGSLRSLGERAIHPNECLLFDERQFRGRAEWNATHGPFQHVLEVFDETAETDWTPVWSLTHERHRLLPTAMLYYGAPGGSNAGALSADSNGNAAGSSLADAVLQGLLELVERDAVALWWYNRTSQPEVDLDAFADPWHVEMRELYFELGRELWVLDLTADLGVPVMAAVSRRRSTRREHILFGFGAHLDPRLALRRALTELNQLMPATLAADSSDEIPTTDRDARHWWEHATVANQPYLRPTTGEAARGPDAFDYRPRTDLAADVDALVAALGERGLETFVLDQTRPDIALPVVKTIVPGLRHFWARFGPGRLFEVPVQLGRISRPTPYEELNPMPMFL
ncbi:TOMM precursor leader peptide-binding protein [Amycolatopsis arida]|nr:TOMM precursor leader peptide-binding protein [Amycolatopsis arida]